MALENILEIEQSFGIEAGKLKEMINSEEVHTIDLSNKVILDKSTYDERIENIKKESGKAMIEIAVKKKREELGLEFTGKNIDNLLEAFKDKVNAESKIEPEEKYKTLHSDFEKIKKSLEDKSNEFDSYKNDIIKKENLNNIKSLFFSGITDETLVSKDTIYLEATVNGYSFENIEGVVVVKDSNGDVLKDDKYNPLKLSDFSKEFSKKYAKPITGGAGAGDYVPPGKPNSFDAFIKEAEQKGWTSSEMNIEMNKRIANKTLEV